MARSQPKIHTAPASMLSKDMQGTSLKTSQNGNEVLSKDIQGISLKTSSSAQKTNEVGRSRESGQVSEAKAAKLVDNLYNNKPPASRRAPTVEGILISHMVISLMIHTHVHILNPTGMLHVPYKILTL